MVPDRRLVRAIGHRPNWINVMIVFSVSVTFTQLKTLLWMVSPGYQSPSSHPLLSYNWSALGSDSVIVPSQPHLIRCWLIPTTPSISDFWFLFKILPQLFGKHFLFTCFIAELTIRNVFATGLLGCLMHRIGSPCSICLVVWFCGSMCVCVSQLPRANPGHSGYPCLYYSHSPE